MADRNIKKRLHRVARAATFALAVISLSVTAVHPAHAAEDGKTKVNVGVTELTDRNISFEVPLYYVMSVTQERGGTAKVTCPDQGAYSITNTSKGTQSVAVTQVGVQGVTGGEWSLVESTSLGSSATDKNIRMTVGGIELPSLTKASQTKHYKATDLGGDNTFHKNGKYVEMKPYSAAKPQDSTIIIPVTAEVSASYQVQANTKPVAQFRLLYTVSPLDKDGNVLRAE